MPRYLLELYLARKGGLDEATAQARRVAEASGAGGPPLRYVRTLYVAEDETCFHVFDASSREVLLEAALQSGLADARVTETVESETKERS